MNQPRKPKKVKAPEGCEDYLTEGKEYNVEKAILYDSYNGYLLILTIDNMELLSNEKNSRHLNGKDWIVTEYEDENN